MSATFAITTLIELAVAILLVYGFMHEEKFIAFEQAVRRIVIGNIRRAIRIHNHKKAVARGEHLRLHTVNTRVSETKTTVA
ncbi:MAG: hypothetical protein IKV25_07665 [Clostridia bacterium]|nr:hypothetical protein [Clostridia bacterium]